MPENTHVQENEGESQVMAEQATPVSSSEPEQVPAQEQQPADSAEAQLQKDLDQREELCREAEQVAAAKDWRHGSSDLRRLQDQWNDIRRWHDPREDALWQRFKVAKDSFFEARDAAHATVKETKEKLVAEAERLAGSTQWKATGDRLHAMMDEWKAAGRTGQHEVDDELWEKFNAARQKFYDRRSEHYDELDKQRAAAKETKERLIEEARAAAVTASDWTGDQWRAASDKMKDLMDQWKKAGVAAKADNDRLWDEFRAARQPFFDAQHAHYDSLDAAHKKAADAKQKLVDEAKALASGHDFGRDATERAKQLDRDWKQIGYAGKEADDRLWEAFRNAKESFWDQKHAFNDARHEQWVQRTQDAIDRRKSRIANLQEQIDRLQNRLNNAYATDHVEEMQERLDEKKKLVTEIEGEIQDMEQRLK